MTTLDVLVLPAFDELPGLPSEREPWIDAYGLDRIIDHDGLPKPLRYNDGVGVVPTGVGKSAAAATVSTLLATDAVDLTDATVLSVGVAGGPPRGPTVGSVVLADRIVDWDNKVRLDPTAEQPLNVNPYNDSVATFEFNDRLVDRATEAAKSASLASPDESVLSTIAQYEAADRSATPSVRTGVNCCADELWHGRELAAQVEAFLARRGHSNYLVTEMEDAGTAIALDRYDRRDAYLSLRAVANFDRPPAGQAPQESLFGEAFEAGFPVAVENAVRAGTAVVEALR